MKNLTRVFVWFIAIAVGMTCLISTVLIITDGLHTAGYAIFFPAILTWSSLQAVVFGSITACLVASYIYIVNREANKARVRLLYAVMGLLVAFAFLFVEYRYRQEQLAISDVCAQFDSTVMRKEYETAYEFMSPDYRQAHSLVQFTAGRVTCGFSGKSVRIVLDHPSARNASVIHIPFGSLNTEIFFEKIDANWYLTGETGHFSG